MSFADLSEIAKSVKQRIHIVTSSVAYAVATIESDSAPRFQLGTIMRIGLSDEEVTHPKVIARMRWEYRAWAIGHALADMLEALASFLNELVKMDASRTGYKNNYERFERLGLDLKIKALPSLCLESEYSTDLERLTRARNCLVHRHGIIGPRDCNDNSELVLQWLGIKFFNITAEGPIEVDPTHRGPALADDRYEGMLKFTRIERRFALGSRLDLEPHDLCTIAWYIQRIAEKIHEGAERIHS